MVAVTILALETHRLMSCCRVRARACCGGIWDEFYCFLCLSGCQMPRLMLWICLKYQFAFFPASLATFLLWLCFLSCCVGVDTKCYRRFCIGMIKIWHGFSTNPTIIRQGISNLGYHWDVIISTKLEKLLCGTDLVGARAWNRISGVQLHLQIAFYAWTILAVLILC